MGHNSHLYLTVISGKQISKWLLSYKAISDLPAFIGSDWNILKVWFG
jgi:hypothetical protein